MMWYEWKLVGYDIGTDVKREYNGIVRANNFAQAIEEVENDYDGGDFGIEQITIKDMCCQGNTLEYKDISTDFNNLFTVY